MMSVLICDWLIYTFLVAPIHEYAHLALSKVLQRLSKPNEVYVRFSFF